MIALTGATGQLGHYVLQDLLNTVPARLWRRPQLGRFPGAQPAGRGCPPGRLQRRSGADRRAAGRINRC